MAAARYRAVRGEHRTGKGKLAAAATRRRRLFWGVVAAIGYILSPLSFWNDMFVNVPLAWLAAKLLNHLLGLNEMIGFQVGYAVSNIAGVMLLIYGVAGMTTSDKPLSRGQVAKSFIVSTLYGIAASIVLAALGVLSPG